MSDHMLAPILEQLPQNIDPVSREGVMLVESMLSQLVNVETPENCPSFPLTHRFADGVYAREIFLPAGSIVVGKIHRFGHLNILTKGKCIVLTEFGVERLEAPCTFISKPGTKRVVGSIEDTVWTTIHGVGTETDLDKIEDQIICKTYADYDALMLREDMP